MATVLRSQRPPGRFLKAGPSDAKHALHSFAAKQKIDCRKSFIRGLYLVSPLVLKF
jgi:hypothetical protein